MTPCPPFAELPGCPYINGRRRGTLLWSHARMSGVTPETLHGAKRVGYLDVERSRVSRGGWVRLPARWRRHCPGACPDQRANARVKAAASA